MLNIGQYLLSSVVEIGFDVYLDLVLSLDHYLVRALGRILYLNIVEMRRVYRQTYCFCRSVLMYKRGYILIAVHVIQMVIILYVTMYRIFITVFGHH